MTDFDILDFTPFLRMPKIFVQKEKKLSKQTAARVKTTQALAFPLWTPRSLQLFQQLALQDWIFDTSESFTTRTGIIYNVTKSAVGIIINKKVGNRFLEKRVNIRIEHIKHSKC
ncbi:hypothetical protein BGX20_006191, partial [Mortierella sp. AD010]